ncbi:MAG TPA: S41 family peptidase [Puia sp.]|nr:S41 family peptidase [Puia sp.]
MAKSVYLIIFPAAFLVSCTTTKHVFDPNTKIPVEKLRADYAIFRGVLEESHPSLYWYTSKDSMDYYFNRTYDQLNDSMTETKFRTLLSYVVAKIDCGHTAVKYSKKYVRYLDTAKLKTFPLSLKFWEDTVVVTANLDRRDSVLKRGTILRSIDGFTPSQLRDSLFNYVVTDGYSLCGKYQTLSTGFAFANLYKYVFGLRDTFNLRYLDSLGEEREAKLPVYDFRNDTMNRWGFAVTRTPGSKKKIKPQLIFFSGTNLQLDTASRTAYMALNTFDRGNHLKKFFHHSFRTLKENKINHLVIDVRSNGGGDAGNSTLLTRYLINQKFKLADSLYAITRSSRYDRYIGKSRLYHLMMLFISKKKADGKYHFGYFERRYYHPRKKNHFDGDVYILMGGNSFSATTLFAGSLKGQQNITLVGEETGGGYYGNTAWVIQDVTLPNSKIRFSLPKFRLVIKRDREKNGRGVMPDVLALPTTDAIRKGIDFKSQKARELIDGRTHQKK